MPRAGACKAESLDSAASFPGPSDHLHIHLEDAV